MINPVEVFDDLQPWEPWQPQIGQRVRVRSTAECPNISGDFLSWSDGQLINSGFHWEGYDGRTGVVIAEYRHRLDNSHPYRVLLDDDNGHHITPDYAAIELEPV